MPAKPSTTAPAAAAAPATTCCADAVLIDDNDTARRCQSCGAQWARDTRDGEWQEVPFKSITAKFDE